MSLALCFLLLTSSSEPTRRRDQNTNQTTVPPRLIRQLKCLQTTDVEVNHPREARLVDLYSSASNKQAMTVPPDRDGWVV